MTENINNFHMHFVVGYVLYYVCGYYISRVTWKKKYTVMTFMLFIFSYVAAFILSNMNSANSGLANQEVYGEFSLLGFLINISIFAIFKAFSEKTFISTKGKKLVCYGIGIYLLHPLFLEYMVYFPDLYRIVGAILLYLVCIIICMMIEKSRLLKKLLLNGA